MWSSCLSMHCELPGCAWPLCGDRAAGMQVAGTAGTMVLSDYVIPATETSCSFQLRDAKFLDALATKVQQKVQSHTVRMRAPTACAVRCLVHVTKSQSRQLQPLSLLA